MSVRISLLASIRSTRAFSTFSTLPRSGRIACVARSRPDCAEPPAESPSTRNSSVFAGSRSEQSRSLPGSDSPSITPLRTVSRALRAASRARKAIMILLTTASPTDGFSSKKVMSRSLTIESTMPCTSPLPSFVFVWPSNCGWGTFTLTITVRPSRMSSPVTASFSLMPFFIARPYLFTVRVSAARKPERCVPPSTVWMLLQYVCSSVEKLSVYCIDTSATTVPVVPGAEPSKWMTGVSGFLFALRYSMNASMPPS